MEFSRPGYWTGWPFPSPGDLPDPGIEPGSPALQADSLPSDPTYKPQERSISIYKDIRSRLRRITKAQFSVYGLKHSSLISLNSREIAAPAQGKNPSEAVINI